MTPIANWTRRVNAIMKHGYAITLADAGADAGDIERYWRDEPSPDAFVRWFARKHDLVGVVELGLGRHGFRLPPE